MGAGAFALACDGIRCTVAAFVVVTVTDQPVVLMIGGSHLQKKKKTAKTLKNIFRSRRSREAAAAVPRPQRAAALEELLAQSCM